MNITHVGRPRRVTSRRLSGEKQAYSSRDYFGEALRILDNDLTIVPQREHLAALWGLVVGLTRRLTQTLVEYRDYQSPAISEIPVAERDASVVRRNGNHCK